MTTTEQANRTADIVHELGQLRRQRNLTRMLHVSADVPTGKGDEVVTICCHDEMLWPCPSYKIVDGHYIAPENVTEP